MNQNQFIEVILVKYDLENNIAYGEDNEGTIYGAEATELLKYDVEIGDIFSIFEDEKYVNGYGAIPF